MNVTGPVKQVIIDDASAAAVLGSRVYANVIPQSATFPAALLRITNVQPLATKTGPSDLDIVTLACYSFAENYNTAQNCDELIRAAIDDFSGPVTVGAIVHGIRLITYKPGASEDFVEEPKMAQVSSVYTVCYQRDAGAMVPVNLIGGTFDSDSDALAAGLEVGQYYYASRDHEAAVPGTLIKLLP